MKMVVFLVPVVFFLAMLAVKIFAPDYYTSLIQEDTLIENLQFWFYLAASIVAFLVSIIFLRNKIFVHGVLFGVLAFGLLLTSMEEISWGQRAFGIASPDYFQKHNKQREISLHNLYPVQRKLHVCYMTVGAYGAFAWIFASLISSKIKSKFHDFLRAVIPDWFLSSYFFFTFLVYVLLSHPMRKHLRHFVVSRDQEPMELLLSLGFLLFAITQHMRLRTCLSTGQQPRSPSAGTSLKL